MSNALGRRLRLLRRRAGLSATALAGDTMAVSTISRIEHGAIAPSLATLRHLAARIGCPVAELLAEEDEEAPVLAALEEAEAWLLLDMPQVAVERVDAPMRDDIADVTERGNIRRGLASGRRLHWVKARATAQLNSLTAPALDPLVSEARRAGDPWSAASLAMARAGTLDSEAALASLEAALQALPPAEHDTPAQQLARAELSLLLARHFEAAGEVETARGLYTAAVTLGELFRNPAALAQRLLRPSLPPGPDVNRRTGRSAPVADRPQAMSAGFAVALFGAGARLRRAAIIDLARLDVQSRRLTDAARRLRGVAPTDGSAAELAVLGSFWAGLDPSPEPGPERSPPQALNRLRRAVPPGLQAQVAEELVRLETAAQAGRPGEAERTGALLATSLAGEEPALARAIWLRLARAWADAGNAPRAARALRAADQTGEEH